MNSRSGYDVIVIGGGAAGLMCAIEAGKRGRSVLVIERNDAIGKKILISGGGRCNFTNLYAEPENYLCSNPHFHKSALARFTPADFISIVEGHGIAYHEKKLGQLFCDGSARQVVDMLERDCLAAGVEIVTGCAIEDVDHPGSFELATSLGSFTCEALVVASGGLSIPKIGASGFGYDLARQFGLDIVEPRPGLVPMTFSGREHDLFESLSGVSMDVIATAGKQPFHENLLFTHHGLSGPAILQASSYWQPGDWLTLNLLPFTAAIDLLVAPENQARTLAAVLAELMPRRFAEAWVGLYAHPLQLANYTSTQRETVSAMLHDWRLRPSGSQGFARAEVTVGGIDTDALSSKTMESRRVPGLHFIGEIVDVTGWLGGYNFQWAWASGFAAGQNV